MINLENVTVIFKNKKALDHISYDFGNSGLYLITGPSGSGKTTLLNCISNNLSNYDGKILYNNQDISSFDSSQQQIHINKNIGFIYQDLNLFDGLTVLENLQIGISFTEEELTKTAKYLLIDDLLDSKVKFLSGGEAQRVAIARMILKNSNIVIADEPTANLDDENAINIINYLAELSTSRLVIVVSHDKNRYHDVANHIIELKKGKIVSDVKLAPQNRTTSLSISSTSIDVVSAKTNFKLVKESFFKNRKIIILSSLLFLLLMFASLSLSNIWLLDYAKSEESIIQLENSTKNVFEIQKNVSCSPKLQTYYNVIQKGFYIENDFASYDIAKEYEYDGFSYLLVDNYDEVKLKDGRYPQNQNEIIASVDYIKEYGYDPVSIDGSDYSIVGISEVRNDITDNYYIISTYNLYSGSSFSSNVPNSYQNKCYYYSNEDLTDYNDIMISSGFARFYNLSVGDVITPIDFYDSKYNGVFTDCINVYDFSQQLRITNITATEDFKLFLNEELYADMAEYYNDHLSYDAILVFTENDYNFLSFAADNDYVVIDQSVNLILSQYNWWDNTLLFSKIGFVFVSVVLFLTVLLLIWQMFTGFKKYCGIIKSLGIKKRYLFTQYYVFVFILSTIIFTVGYLCSRALIHLLNSGLLNVEEYPNYEFIKYNNILVLATVLILYILLIGFGSLEIIVNYRKPIKKLLVKE